MNGEFDLFKQTKPASFWKMLNKGNRNMQCTRNEQSTMQPPHSFWEMLNKANRNNVVIPSFFPPKIEAV